MNKLLILYIYKIINHSLIIAYMNFLLPLTTNLCAFEHMYGIFQNLSYYLSSSYNKISSTFYQVPPNQTCLMIISWF